MEKVYDHIIIGSGFGGSVSAMRLAEKGYDVLVIEKGKRWKNTDFPETNWNVRRFLWLPLLRCFGFMRIDILNRILIFSGNGVGGGSLVYANTHMFPPDAFFNNPVWSGIRDWKQTLEPFYAKARFMLGSTQYIKEGPEDRILKEIAKDMGKSDTYEPVDHIGVYLGDSGKDVDPYFNGLGPKRRGCIECAGCMVGCRYNAKNTLDKNYLWFAEQWGTQIEAEREVTRVEYKDGLYHVTTVSSTSFFGKQEKTFKAKGIVFSAGVLGTLRLLFKQKHDLKTLTNLSDQLGANLRTNSESLCGIAGIPEKMNHGVAISRVFNPDDDTHIELVKYPDRSGAMGLLAVMAAGDGPAIQRTLSSFWTFISSPRRTWKVLSKDFAKHSIILLVMQSLDNALRIEWKRGIFGKGLHVKDSGGERAPAYIPIGQEVMHRYAEKSGGVAMNNMGEVFLNMSSTAHILGGCPMGKDATEGVVNDRFEVHGYPNMRILDGSIVPCNLGVNPSLTITALSEYAMSLVPEKEGVEVQTLEERMEGVKSSAAMG